MPTTIAASGSASGGNSVLTTSVSVWMRRTTRSQTLPTLLVLTAPIPRAPITTRS